MTDLAAQNRITAGTVARLVKIQKFNREKDENAYQRKVMDYFRDKARCDRCFFNGPHTQCKFMRENRYYPRKCMAHKEKGGNQ